MRQPVFSVSWSTACAVFFAVLLFVGCRKEKGTRTVTITGRVLQNCSGAPAAGRHMRMSVEYTRGFLSRKDPPRDNPNAGSGVTDADGRFSFSFLLEDGNGTLALLDADAVDPQYSQWLGNLVGVGFPAEQNGVINVGTLYDTLTLAGTINVHATGGFMASDTLYYGSWYGEPTTVFPIDSAVLTYTQNAWRASLRHYDMRTGRPDTAIVFWGIGRMAYDNALASYQAEGSASTLRLFKLPLYPCAASSDGMVNLLLQ